MTDNPLLTPDTIATLVANHEAGEPDTYFNQEEAAEEAVESVESETQENEEIEENEESESEEEEADTEEEPEDEGEEELEVDEGDDDESDPEKLKSLSALRQQAKYEKQLRVNAEAELNQLKQWLQSQAEATPDDGSADPDEYIDDKAAKEIEQLKAQQAQQSFQTALNMAQQDANARIPDFQNAYDHIANQKAQEMAAVHGLPPEQASAQAAKFMSAVALNAHQKGGNIADTFYALAKSTGYTAAQQVPVKKKGINPKAIAKNKAKTEKKSVKSGAVDDFSNASATDLIAKFANKNGKIDPREIQKLIARKGM